MWVHEPLCGKVFLFYSENDVDDILGLSKNI